MNRHIHQTITGRFYEVKARGGRKPLPEDIKLSETVKGMVTKSMRAELDELNRRGYRDTLIINLALREWLDRQKSVQLSV